jgi:hypothetical protein
MKDLIRRKLEMVARVLDCCRNHLLDNGGFTAAVARLEEGSIRAQAMARQERAGRLTVRASVVNKSASRSTIHPQLQFLVGIAEAASVEVPEVGARLHLPRPNVKHQTFLTSAQVAVSEATAHKDILIKYGMPDNFLDQLTQAVAGYEKVVNDKHGGITAHVGARADLTAVTDELMQIVEQLDTMNRFRFREDAELLAAWKSARDVAWPKGKVAPPASAAAAEVKPASQ